jgi:hypothetical protein
MDSEGMKPGAIIIMYGIFTTSNKIKTYCVLVKYLNTFSVILKIREFSAGGANKISSNTVKSFQIRTRLAF